jgi:hypothetical protein
MARLAGRVAGVPRALGSFLDRRGGLVLVRVGGGTVMGSQAVTMAGAQG